MQQGKDFISFKILPITITCKFLFTRFLIIIIFLFIYSLDEGGVIRVVHDDSYNELSRKLTMEYKNTENGLIT